MDRQTLPVWDYDRRRVLILERLNQLGLCLYRAIGFILHVIAKEDSAGAHRLSI